MKRFFTYALLSVALISTSANAKEWELKDYPILTFKEPFLGDLYHYEIKLKAIKMWQGDYDKSLQTVTLSYIVTIKYPLSETDGTVYISLVDKEGFEIVKNSLSRVVENYKGTLKGSFIVTPNEYQKISGAELSFMVDVK